jgi:hypothetical protein
MLARALGLLLLASPLAAQATHTDFTGTWVLDAAKSSSDGQLPVPTAATYVVGMHGDSITVDIKTADGNGEMSLKKLYAVDGYNWLNSMTYQGTTMNLSSVLKWNGAALAIQTTTDFGGTPVQQSETWKLAEDKKTLTIAITTYVDGAPFSSQTLAFNKK